MAGTLPAFSMSMQFDKNTGKQLKSGKLYFYAANTQNPQNAYFDAALSVPHPNPITLDGAGRIPEFYLADGTIHVRLTNAAGTTQFEALNALVIGPSSGGGGGGGGVDPTTVFQTGDVIWVDYDGTRTGWVRDNGRTIGSATSGASERANADCQSLFTYLWNNFADTICPVGGGRGASAAADWAANKQITLPDKRGRVATGLDTMGAASSGRFTAATPMQVGSVSVAGSLGGENAHTLTSAEMPSHTHTASVTDPGHVHSMGINATSGVGGAAGFVAAGGSQNTGSATTGISVSNANTGGGTTHNTMPMFTVGTFFRKL